MKFLCSVLAVILTVVLSSCSGLQWRTAQSHFTHFTKRSLATADSRKVAENNIFDIQKGDAFNIALSKSLLTERRNFCQPEFSAKIKVLFVKKNSVLLSYKAPSKNKKFCKNGTKIIMTKTQLNKHILGFFRLEKMLYSIEKQLPWILTNKHSIKTSNQRYAGDKIRLRNKNLLMSTVGLKNTFPLKVKNQVFTATYLKQIGGKEGSLTMGKLCKIGDKNLKILGFIRWNGKMRALGDSILAQVRGQQTGNFFKLLKQLMPVDSKNNHCPVGSYVLISSQDVM